MKTYVRAKLHGVRVKDKSLHYDGSVAVGTDLLAAAGMEPFERVDVVNLANGCRWSTYLMPDDRPGWFSLNGGGARLGEVGDECVLMVWVQAEAFPGALAVHVGRGNKVLREARYGCGAAAPGP